MNTDAWARLSDSTQQMNKSLHSSNQSDVPFNVTTDTCYSRNNSTCFEPALGYLPNWITQSIRMFDHDQQTNNYFLIDALMKLAESTKIFSAIVFAFNATYWEIRSKL